MKAIVFGGSGFLGSHVVDSLCEKGYRVTIFDKHSSPYLQMNQKMVIGDILNREEVKRAVEGCDYVYNYAGIADLDDASTRPVDTIMLNIVGTCNIMDACVQCHVKRFVYASSFYANSDKGGFYRCSKQAAEIYIEEYLRKYNLNYTILRYGSLYGPRADRNNGLLCMLQAAYLSGEIQYMGTGEETREYIHVKDAAELSVKILEENFCNKHIVLTGHDAYKIKDIIAVISEILNKNISAIYEKKNSELHYDVTPYAYKPQGNMKLVSDYYHDIGQGLIECLEEIAAKGE